MKKVAAAFVVTAVAGCSVTSGIVPASSGPSEFSRLVFQGTTTVINEKSLSGVEYRVFNQGANHWVSAPANREDAENRATEFCKQKGKEYRALVISMSNAPHTAFNLPKAEVTFECIEPTVQPQTAPTKTSADDNSKYSDLAKLKKLLDDGAITQAEFQREKDKILSKP